jgi:type I restriction enzyme S subunit
MPSYESYKPSGVAWIGDVPAHWEVLPGFTCFKENKDRNRALKEKTVLSLSYGRIVIKPEEKMTGLVPETFETYQLIKPGDIVIRTTDLQNDKTSLRVGLAKDRGMITSAYLGLHCNPEINSHYIFRLLESYDALKVFYGMGSGLRQNIDFWDFKRLSIPLPPRPEQERIVNFLDKKIVEIDAAILKKKKLIDLLQEQKSVLTNHAVTRGLIPQVPMRDTEVEWIREIPAHWDLVPLKYVSTVQSGVTLGKSYPQSGNVKSYPYLRVANVQDGFLALSQITEIRLSIRDAKNYFLKSGDILVTEGGDIDKLGRGTCWYGEIDECLHQNHVFAIRIVKRVLPEYMSLITGVAYARRYFTNTANKTTNLASTNKTKLGNLPLLIPPLEEQKSILAYFENIKRQFDALTGSIIKEISALKEMKGTLITEAVTGKIKI